MEELDDRTPGQGAGRILHWLHLGALLVLVGAVETGRGVLGGSTLSEALLALPHSLYSWCPIVAGVAVSIRRADRRTSKAAIKIGAVVTVLMLGLDVLGGMRPPPGNLTLAMTTEGRAERAQYEAAASWVLTGLAWVRGDLAGARDPIGPGRGSVPPSHPRLRAADSLLDASLTVLVFGVLGLVVAASRWIRGHVTFQRPEDERGAHLVVAWLLSPLAVMVALPQTDDLHFAVITDDGPLWAILVPSLAILAVGVVAWIRSHPHVPDEPDDPGAPPDADEP